MTLDTFSTSGQKNSRDHINILLKPNKGMASYFIRRVEEGISEGHRVFKIKFPDKAAPLFPNYCVPLAGAIDYYRASHNCVFLPSRSTSGNSPAGKIGLLEPFTDFPDSTTGPFLNKIWKFDESNHYELVSGIVSSIRRSIEFGRGVLSSIELCLNEVTDNILLHASRQDDCLELGYVMAQVHKESGRIAIAVYDNGAGIPSSLRSAGYEFDGPEAAILLALQRGVTDNRGAGNGLWVLNETVRAGRGSLEITTDGVQYSLRHLRGEEKATFSLRSKMPIGGTTLVDFQLKATDSISLEDIVGESGMVDLWAEAHEDVADERDMRLSVKKESAGLGSRFDAEQFRMLVENCLVEADGKVIIDFEGVESISLSFADELIRKLVSKYGLIGFMQRFRMENLSRECAAAINAVTKQ